MKNLHPSVLVHKLAEVLSSSIGNDTRIWQFAIILPGASIGANCNINCHTFIENNVVIGNNVTIKPGVYLWDGTLIEDNVFLGPNVTFTNDKFPRSKIYPKSFQKTVIKKGASIGANATILGGVSVGEFALVGAGSVVTKSIPDYGMVTGNPAKIVGWIDEDGNTLEEIGDEWINKKGKKYIVENKRLIAL